MNLSGISVLEKRLARLERNNYSSTTLYKLADGSVASLKDQERKDAWTDAIFGIDTPNSTILVSAVADNSGGQLLALLRVILNPIETMPDPNEVDNVGGEPVAHKRDNHSIQQAVSFAEQALFTAERELIQTRNCKPVLFGPIIYPNAQLDYDRHCEQKQKAFDQAKIQYESAIRARDAFYAQAKEAV